ncbi:hypothetical protein BSL82_09600 [Tardibacter chloracetimidivorans]|uniref:Uncharacterized protein n=1 Tax=Tardibacter chloracetimidivorans TaxID=1921510 RepID=A0A1L3ZV91_9SPHN|nr:hypothetical protein [Tardibacter chloracetimidivorans]API59535.1 hypothetical protein BSL82_09600 [Tardibacter chloracetimidivorans]
MANDMASAKTGDMLIHEDGTRWEVIGFYTQPSAILQRVDAQIGAVTENTRLAVDPTSPWASNWRAIQKEGHGG